MSQIFEGIEDQAITDRDLEKKKKKKKSKSKSKKKEKYDVLPEEFPDEEVEITE